MTGLGISFGYEIHPQDPHNSSSETDISYIENRKILNREKICHLSIRDSFPCVSKCPTQNKSKSHVNSPIFSLSLKSIINPKQKSQGYKGSDDKARDMNSKSDPIIGNHSELEQLSDDGNLTISQKLLRPPLGQRINGNRSCQKKIKHYRYEAPCHSVYHAGRCSI